MRHPTGQVFLLHPSVSGHLSGSRALEVVNDAALGHRCDLGPRPCRHGNSRARSGRCESPRLGPWAEAAPAGGPALKGSPEQTDRAGQQDGGWTGRSNRARSGAFVGTTAFELFFQRAGARGVTGEDALGVGSAGGCMGRGRVTARGSAHAQGRLSPTLGRDVSFLGLLMDNCSYFGRGPEDLNFIPKHTGQNYSGGGVSVLSQPVGDDRSKAKPVVQL